MRERKILEDWLLHDLIRPKYADSFCDALNEGRIFIITDSVTEHITVYEIQKNYIIKSCPFLLGRLFQDTDDRYSVFRVDSVEKFFENIILILKGLGKHPPETYIPQIVIR